MATRCQDLRGRAACDVFVYGTTGITEGAFGGYEGFKR